MMTLFQINLHFVFDSDSDTMPMWKLNGGRLKEAQNAVCSYIKNQIIMEKVD